MPAVEAVRGARVLHVEPHGVMRLLISEVLGDEGHEVTGVPHIKDGIVAVKKGPFDVVVVEPFQDGIYHSECLGKMLDHAPDSHFIGLTGAPERVWVPVDGIYVLSKSSGMGADLIARIALARQAL